MQIPAYATATVNAYQTSGSLEGKRNRLDYQTLVASLQNLKDDFTYWQRLDESEFDLAKGKPGQVLVSTHPDSGACTEVRFSGDTYDGELAVTVHEPNPNFGFSSYQQVKFTARSAESLLVSDGPSGANLVHIERNLTWSDPVILGTGPTSPMLTDHAWAGYTIHQGQARPVDP
ncbi:MAG: hypothetical protein U0931_38770 [Vulcanimicrobiota bacterium]